MGWWAIPGNETVEVGDDVFSATYRYLEEITEMYQEGLGRRLTVADLEGLLTIALQVHGGPETFSGVEELEVASVTIKTKKRPKRQRIAVGDVFTFPIAAGKWAFGRIVNLYKSWDLVEIYAHVAPEPRYSPEVTAAGPIAPPILIEPEEVFSKSRWRVIHHDPTYDAKWVAELEYTTDAREILRVNKFLPEPNPSLARMAKLPRYFYTHVETTEATIREELQRRGLLEPGSSA